MTAPMMKAYTDLLVQTCHKRGAFAIGGMAAFIPSRKDEEVNRVAFEKVRADKVREANDGFDGSWVAHPDLVPVCKEVFDSVLGTEPNQIDRQRPEVHSTIKDILAVSSTPGEITEAGMRYNIDIAIQYLSAWLAGLGAVCIHNLMEDAATAEISRSQVWQWIRSPKGVLDDGRKITAELVKSLVPEELAKIKAGGFEGKFERAAEIFTKMSTQEAFEEFLTLPLYEEI